MNPRILLVGAGYVGMPLAAKLVADGAQVVAIRRKQAALPPGVRLHRADLCQPESLSGLEGPWAAVVILISADQFTEASYRRHYLDGVGNLLRTLKAQPQSPRLVFVSSTGVYGQTDGAWVDEASPTEPPSFSGQVMLEAERQVADAGFPFVILRFGGIYGPGRERLLRMVAEGEARLPSQPLWTNRIHRSDAAAAIAHVLSLDTLPDVLNVVDTEPADLRDVLKGLAERLGMPVPPVDPAPVLRTRGGNKRVSSRRLQETGFQFRYPTWREGFASILAARKP